jgi:hypothetical protein
LQALPRFMRLASRFAAAADVIGLVERASVHVACAAASDI